MLKIVWVGHRRKKAVGVGRLRCLKIVWVGHRRKRAVGEVG